MISKVKIKNFQSHKDTEIDLCPGVNTIVGSSDHGKTAVIRAINWVLNNRPLGEGFRSWFANKESTVVSLTLDDGEVGRARGKDENVYILNGEKLRAVGSDVPDIVSDKLRMEEVNVQLQHDPPFLFSETSGSVSKFLNKAVNLSKIDSTQKNIITKQRKTDSDIKYLSADIILLDEKLKTIPDITKLETAILNVEEDQKQLDDIEYTIKALDELVDQIDEINSSLEGPDLSSLIARANKTQEYINDLNTLNDTINDLTKTKNEIGEINSQIKRGIHLPVDKIEASCEVLEGLNAKISAIQKAVNLIKFIQEDNNKIYKIIAQKDLEFRQLMGTKCPLCGSILMSEKKKVRIK